jgi:mono/diheme cytochrome c family protein
MGKGPKDAGDASGVPCAWRAATVKTSGPSGAARVVAWGLTVAACGASAGGGRSPLAYLDDPSFRRAELVQSLADPGNGYSRLRLAHYATGDAGDWERLPEWNPPAAPIVAGELDAPGGVDTSTLSDGARALRLPASVTSIDDPALLSLGEAAFFGYPSQVASYLRVALTSPQAAARYGLWVDAQRGVGGLVRARMADGSVALSLTCSSCHAADRGGVSPGQPNASLDLGSAILEAQGAAMPSSDPIAAWGRGRVDVTTAAGNEPARIPDLRPVRWLTYLQQDADVRAGDITALAIRIETLLITSNQSVVRPPRVLALALAAYVTSLADGLPAADGAAQASGQGARVFETRCTSCHAPPGMTGPPVPLDTIGTDPTLGLSADRGTGTYRVPSLHGVGSRGPLLHDGTLPSVDAMFDPSRLNASFTGRLHGAGRVPGHPYGLDLSAADREALVAYLHAL